MFLCQKKDDELLLVTLLKFNTSCYSLCDKLFHANFYQPQSWHSVLRNKIFNNNVATKHSTNFNIEGEETLR